MTLEVLFARAEQVRAFLLLVAGGAALGAILQLAGWLHRMWKPAGLAADALCAAAAGALLLGAALLTGSGLRAYAVLGAALGIILYRLGVQPVMEGIARYGRKITRRTQEKD